MHLHCPACNASIGVVTNMSNNEQPKPVVGDVSICLKCGDLRVWCADLTLRAATSEEDRVFFADPLITKIRTLLAKRKH